MSKTHKVQPKISRLSSDSLYKFDDSPHDSSGELSLESSRLKTQQICALSLWWLWTTRWRVTSESVTTR